jgi:hypothetical protein
MNEQHGVHCGLIFGHMLTSTNYGRLGRVVGGSGIGSKACNV